MITLQTIIAVTGAYLIGSVPTAVWLGRFFYKTDVREYGSGNSGATNTFRVLGAKAGLPVLFIDILKGVISVNLAHLVAGHHQGTEPFYNLQLALAVAAMFGHIFPVFANFRGGKGVATMMGIILAVHFHAALICIGIFLLLLLLTRFVSLSSIITGFSFPLIIMFLFHNSILSLNIFSIFVSILILITHQKNIERLVRGKESRVNILKIKKV